MGGSGAAPAKGGKRKLPRGKAGRRAALKTRALRENEEMERVAAVLADPPADLSAVSRQFVDFPLSSRTTEALTEAGFVEPTAVQRETLMHALNGRDVLAAAKTGSGKTLAFLVPLLERLWALKWSNMDGAGAVVISPTRELALQTFQCLAQVGSKHDMSAGLIIGGTTFEREQANITHTNILICTPGRLLQHLDETPNFDCTQLQLLVLDEADRILDLGFAKAMDAILQSMPSERQTMLFSATQTNSVDDLARLSLKSPAVISTTPASASATPDQLVQAYVQCPLNRKLDILFSFIKSHLESKMLVFVSSCKQVRYIYETFRRFRPGVPLMALYGKQKQMKRVAIFTDFTKKKAAVLFATDIASRGLDFPSVDWVFQLDCPESVETYIHRVGRTARYNAGGKALMTLLPSEAEMLNKLKAKQIDLLKTDISETAMKPVTPLLQSLCASDTELKYLAQKCFISYARSVHLQSDKDVFDVNKLPIDEYATSLGLPSTPRIKFTKKKVKKVTPKPLPNFGDDEDDTGEETEVTEKSKKQKSKFERLRASKNQDVLAPHRLAVRSNALGEDSGDSEDDLLVKSGVQRHANMPAMAVEEDPAAQQASRKRRKDARTRAEALKKDAPRAKHLTFSEDGHVRDEKERLVGWEPAEDEVELPPDVAQHDLDQAKAELAIADVGDRERQRERLRAKRRKRKMREREYLDDETTAAELGGVQLGRPDSDDDATAATVDEVGQRDEKRRKPVEAAGVDTPAALKEDEDLALWLIQNS